jgi:hypothetical protein
MGIAYCKRCQKGWSDFGMVVYCPDCHSGWEFWFGGIFRLTFLLFCLSLCWGLFSMIWWKYPGMWWPSGLLLLVFFALGLVKRVIDPLLDAGWLSKHDPRHPFSNASPR